MERQAQLRKLSFLSALARAQQRYSLDMTEDDFIEEGYNIWRSIGNIAPVTRRFFATVQQDMLVELPKDCELIESVTTTTPTATKKYNSAGVQRILQQNDTTLTKDQSLINTQGEAVNYSLEKNNIRITSAELIGANLLIIYNAILVDSDGLPMLNDKEVNAIAAEVTKREIFKRAFQGIKGADKILGVITMEADRLMTAAKVDEYINDDSLDKLLDIKASWDRKTYGNRINLIR